jgi:anti-anti-sigma factor
MAVKFECNDTADGDLIIVLDGEMDTQGCAGIRADLERIPHTKNPKIIFDLERVSFLDSSGIGAIVFLYKRLRAQDRAFVIVGVQGQPQELIKLLRIDRAIPVSEAPVNSPAEFNPLRKAS